MSELKYIVLKNKGTKMSKSGIQSLQLRRYAWLSIAAAVATIVLKSAAYAFTGSVGLLSDALESFVNLAGALMAFAMLTLAARPADEEHAFGHNKAEYFSSGVEGGLILLAAIGIIATAVPRLISPAPLEKLGIGIIVSLSASLINLAVALLLRRGGRRFGSIVLEADARHLLTDVWTSAGVLTGIAVVALTGWTRLDAIVALVVAANIVWAGFSIIKESVQGLMDAALPEKERHAIEKVLRHYETQGIQFHALRTRKAGIRRFIAFHVLVPGEWTVHQGHLLLEEIEEKLHALLANVTVLTHLESLEDQSSFEDKDLDR